MAGHFVLPARHRVLAFLGVLAFLTYFDRFCITRVQGQIQTDLGIGDAKMGLVFGAFWLAYSLFEIPGGWMGDRYGARITLTRIVLAWSLFTVLTGCSTGLISLLIYRFLFGAGEAGAFPNMARVQSRWFPARSRARIGGMLWLLARFGGALAPLLFGTLMRLFDGYAMESWRPAFWLVGTAGVIWCIAFYIWFRDDPAAMQTVSADELKLIQGESPGPIAKHSMPWAAWKRLIASPTLWAIALLYIFGSFGWSFFASWLPKYFLQVHAVPFADSEIRTGLPLVFGGIACLAGGALSDAVVRRTGRKWLGRAIFPLAGYGLAAAAMFSLPLVDSPEQATVLVCLAGFGNDFGQGANWATIVDVGGLYAGTAAGFVNTIGNTGHYLQPPIGALIFDSLGWNVLLGVYGACYFLAGSMWFFIRPDERLDALPPRG
jgi:MFS transporter, ACS family, glucarate transporter